MKQLTLSWEEWLNNDATSMAALVKAGEVTPTELAAQAAAACILVNPHINAVLEIFDDVVKDPFKDGMNSEGPFCGVPMLVKDLMGVRGRKFEMGFGFLKDYISTDDWPCIANLRNAGFNLMGRTSVPALGFAGVSDSLVHGVTRNPWNPIYTPSGSSGGSAAALAAGIVPIVTASDGGGSTRSPAGWGGLVGLKTTRGRLPFPPLYGNEYTVPYVSEGVMSHSVRDSAYALDIMCQHRLGDSFIPLAVPQVPYRTLIEQDPPKLKIALLTGNCGRTTPVAKEVWDPVYTASKVLTDLGHIVEEVDSDELCNWSEFWPHVDVTWIGGARFWPEMVKAFGRQITNDNLESVFLHLIDAAQDYDWDMFRAAQAANPVYTRQIGQFFEQYDLILTPVEAQRPPKCGPESPASPLHPVNSPEEAVQFIRDMTDGGRFMVPANEAGFPAIALPVELDDLGIPQGIQLQAAWGREDLLLQVSAQIERAQPDWFGRRPPLNVAAL